MMKQKKKMNKQYGSIVIEAKNLPSGSYAAGCRVNYGGDDCYICDYGG